MMQDKSQSELIIGKADQGGYIVETRGSSGGITIIHLAVTTLDEALQFVRAKMK